MKKNKLPIITKIVIYLILVIFPLFILPTTTRAADNFWFHQDFPEWYVKTLDTSNPTEIFGERYTLAQVQWILYSIPAHFLTSLTLGRPEPWICIFNADASSCITGAIEIIKEVIQKIYDFFSFPIRLLTMDPNPRKTNESLITYLPSFLYNNPLSGTGYIVKKISSLSVVSTAEAQGFGYTHGGAAVQKLWKITRDLSYYLLIIVSIVMAFMIMFRVKLSPQAVITFQSAIPKIIFTLILITFSYAIAGLLIDLMYVLIGIFSFLLEENGVVHYSATELFKDLTSDRNVLVLSWHYVFMFAIGTITTLVSSGFFGGLLLIIFFVVVLLATIINCLKILWIVVKTYLNILMNIVTAPLQILLGVVVPGMGFNQWVRGLIANLMVYPVIGIMFVFSFFLIVQAASVGSGSGGGKEWFQFLARIAPFQINTGFLETTTAWDPPLTWGTNSGRFLWMLTSFTIYMLIPKVADIIKSKMEEKLFAYGTAIGEGIRPATTIGTGTLQYFATGSEMQYQKIPEGGEVPGGVARQKKFFDILRRLGIIK